MCPGRGGAELFRKRGGLALLLALFTDPARAAVLGTSRRNLELALSLLANGCTEAGSRSQVRELDGIPALVSILQSVCIDSIWNRVSRALGNLALDPLNSVIIHQSAPDYVPVTMENPVQQHHAGYATPENSNFPDVLEPCTWSSASSTEVYPWPRV
ncbi:unnamed protein product [Ranitomeya imitator]|uniref:Uncharacterized protein n=1 Tax=Ranitomeya imitator TaxID=111125 RepID=A0ABN9LD62_9NEOB|nr:unnamed protein product [Ranitomeya imitator]